MSKSFLRSSVLAAALMAAVTPAMAGQRGPFSQTYFFGDSLTDAGFFRPLLPPSAQPITGQFTTNPGYVWSQYLSQHYGTNADPGWTASPTGPKVATGTNYAVGGARTGTDAMGALGPTPSITTQVNTYLAANSGRADANALYTVWGGANDLFAATAVPAQAQAIVGAAVQADVAAVAKLQAAGARYVLVPNVPDLGITPAFRAQGATAMAQGTALASAYNTALYGALAQQNLQVIPLDTFHLLREITADPTTYGFTNVTGTACQPQITAQSLTCNPTTYVSPDAPNTYAFADGVHPTSRAHAILASYAASVIEAPRQVQALSRSAQALGRARAEMVAAQAESARRDGRRWWADLRLDGQRMKQGDVTNLYAGHGPTGTIGVDWTNGATTYGVFGGIGRQTIKWGQGGDFRQTDTTLGGYLAWHAEALWANAQASYTHLGFDTRRAVVLGPAVRTHHASPKGRTVTLAGNVGYEFGHEAFRHGPMAGLQWQQVKVDGFAEDSPTLSTSMAFDAQSGTVVTASVGWKARYAINDHVEPFAYVALNKAWQDDADAQRVTARLQTLPGNGFVSPGLPEDDSYATLGWGIRAQRWGMDILTGTSLQLQKDGHESSVHLSVSGGF